MTRSLWYHTQHWHSWSRASSKKPKSKQKNNGQWAGTHGPSGMNIRPGFSSAKSKPVPPLKPSTATQINQSIIRQKLCSLCYHQKHQNWSLRPLKNSSPWCNVHQSWEDWVGFLDLYPPAIQQLCVPKEIASSPCWTSLQFAFSLMGSLPWSTIVVKKWIQNGTLSKNPYFLKPSI